MIIGTNVAPEDDNLSYGTPTPSGTDGAETFGIPAAYVDMMFGDLPDTRDEDAGRTAPDPKLEAAAR
jgi:hypothetical protein